LSLTARVRTQTTMSAATECNPLYFRTLPHHHGGD
jgi:hypothetical protein